MGEVVVSGAFNALPKRTVVRGLFWAVIAANLIYMAALVSLPSPNGLVNIGLEALTQWVPVALFWVVAWRNHFVRRDIVVMAIAVTVSAAGDTYYSLAADKYGNLPSPSPADLGYLLFYPIMLIGLILLVRRQQRHAGVTVILDALVTTFGAGAVLTAVLGPVLSHAAGGATFTDSAIALAYPVLDIVLIAVVAGIVAGGMAGPRWELLLGGLFLIAIGDVVYAVLVDASVYVAGTPLDATWALGLGLMAWWVERQDAPALRERKPNATARIIVPLAAVAASLGVLLYASQRSLPVYVLVLAALTVFLAAAQIALRERLLAGLIKSQEDVVTQLTELDEAKNEMMATLNHEIRTPLASIRGYVELLNDGAGGELSEDGTELLSVVSRNADRLMALADNMLILARLEAHATVFDRRRIDLKELLRAVATRVEDLAVQRGVEVTIEPYPGPAYTLGDVDQLRRSITYVAGNAIKFTPSGGSVRFVTKVEHDEDGEVFMSVSVIDTGIGIPQEELPHIFTKFFRASNARTDAVQGSGLGLSIAEGIIKAHHGTIIVSSSLGAGTTVEVLLPAA